MSSKNKHYINEDGECETLKWLAYSLENMGDWVAFNTPNDAKDFIIDKPDKETWFITEIEIEE